VEISVEIKHLWASEPPGSVPGPDPWPEWGYKLRQPQPSVSA